MLVSTSMHTMPGCPIMKSKDLAHWEIINYVFDTLEDSKAHNLEDEKDIYGQGSWAATLRFHKGLYYVGFACNDRNCFYIYKSEDIEKGNWIRIAVINQILHDPALIFEEDIPYIIYGSGDIKIVQLKKDLSGLEERGLHQELLHTPVEGIGLRCEGGHAYKVNGMYYLLYIEWPRDGHGRRREICYRANNLMGPYERKIIFDDDMGYRNKGIAQGAIFDTPEGNWYAMLFQDHDSVGRIPYILPVTWEDGWPIIGLEEKAPKEYYVPLAEAETTPLVINDEFNEFNNKLSLNWQWNHNPDNTAWSFTDRRGFLRLTNRTISKKGVLYARNTLTQRTEGPACTGITCIELTGLKPMDCTGLVALQSNFGMIGIRKDEYGNKRVVMCMNDGSYGEKEIETLSYTLDKIYLKIHFNFRESIDIAAFYYSEDGKDWRSIGQEVQMKYTLDHFMGYRIGLFNYGTKNIGGYADFDYFHYEVEK
ncbi:MAG: glycoside hydrolase [Anaerocolumna sp.]|nr:glycoside hydrolase [Anaerocolumna sp.]